METYKEESLMALEFESKYIHFKVRGLKPKTKVYGVHSNSNEDLLGIIKWYAHWRQYCFFPTEETIFSKGCMEDVNKFIENLMNKRKHEVKNYRAKNVWT